MALEDCRSCNGIGWIRLIDDFTLTQYDQKCRSCDGKGFHVIPEISNAPELKEIKDRLDAIEKTLKIIRQEVSV